ncbi:uncharacterized protein LY89DRAFT_683789 [Mollisia scopiformis]|uniref:Uncharacterized protein n=1 Tax=Mollisia scopiformis TaxID=149040 RepID=A0A194XFR3_MOLSC|nr:uncharacterized protein LY89DRAFT_683789 [Mollisia scopiformis]KUJ18969.1 hypothetical protein LY89DRAFT_683789 [Mollisia scopiformis]
MARVHPFLSVNDLIMPRLSQAILSSPVLRSRISCAYRVQSLSRSLQRGIASKSISPKVAKTRTQFPERLLIYHAGTGRTVFLGCLKVTTIFIFSFFSLVFAPTHFYAEEQPVWVAGGVLLSGIIPMLSVAYMTSPFVTYIHLRIPQFARNSRDMLMRYSKNLSKDAELDITTMNFIGKPRVARVKVAELYPCNKRFGLANYERDTEKANSKRPFWMGKAVGLFGVHNTKSNVKEGQVWENVKAAIEKNRT